ncbi:hypothetical protein BV20DRAFT_1027527 [Pilatotrama ljubarskyi]|nr:hypothetical protein BV20DRAFT_1027527 [Pilatotrama ljubarskyi]
MSYYTSRGNALGYGRGRSGSYSAQYNTRQTSATLPPDRDLKAGLRPQPLRTLSKPQPATSAGRSIKPENVKYIGSYNWVEEEDPTIIVPGSPPIWQDRQLPYRVPFDTGIRMVDQNGYRMGDKSCLLPLFRAVEVVAEENADTSLDWSTIDIVTDRNGLRKLMRWLQHSDSGYGEPLKEFRIDLQLGGSKTVLMHRWEKRRREIATPPKSGCGINFERQTTSPAPRCQRSTGHHRIVQYEYGGLKMVVRFEVDACTAQPRPAASSPRTSTAPRITGSRTTTGAPNIDSLADALAGLGVSTSTSNTSTSIDTISVIRAGSQVPQSTIVELVTRSKKYVDQFDWAEKYPQLLLSSTPHLFLGVHDRGTFERVKKHALGSAEMRHVETDLRMQRAFGQLVAVLRSIQELVKEHGQRGRLSLVCQDGVLKVYERTSDAGCLTEDELARFRS